MTKIKFLSTLALVGTAVFGLTACSSSDDVAGEGGTKTGNEQYISVNISNVGSVGTRALDGDYEYGTKEENTITSVRFYLFDSDGNAYPVNEQGQNYIDAPITADPDQTIGTEEVKNDKNIAAKTTAILVINGTKNTTPASMVAIANLTGEQKTALNKARSLDELNAATDKLLFAHTGDGATASNFVMSSSTSFDQGTVSGRPKNTPIIEASTVGHVESTVEAAKGNPVDIYVERLEAKVQTSIYTGKTDGSGTNIWRTDVKYKLNSEGLVVAPTESGEQKSDGTACKVGTVKIGATTTDVYALVAGWGITDQQANVSIFKGSTGINTWGNGSEASSDLGFIWNAKDFHRSFWEYTTPFGSGNDKQLSAYNTWTRKFGTSTYLFPNTPTKKDDFSKAAKNSDVSDLTKVAIAAQLVTLDGEGNATPIEICNFKSLQYVAVADLKTAVATYFKNSTNYVYTEAGSSDEKKFEPAPDDFDFKKLDGQSYQVSPQLKSSAFSAGRTYFKKAADGTKTPVTNAEKEINAELAKAKYYAEVYKYGMTYYYLPIRHLGNDINKLGYYGVVRNHVYRISIDGITGFGTPVWDRTSTYDPLTPTDNSSYIAARISVLSWRIVDSHADIDGSVITKKP